METVIFVTSFAGYTFGACAHFFLNNRIIDTENLGYPKSWKFMVLHSLLAMLQLVCQRQTQKLCDLHTHLLGMGTANEWMDFIRELQHVNYVAVPDLDGSTDMANTMHAAMSASRVIKQAANAASNARDTVHTLSVTLPWPTDSRDVDVAQTTLLSAEAKAAVEAADAVYLTGCTFVALAANIVWMAWESLRSQDASTGTAMSEAVSANAIAHAALAEAVKASVGVYAVPEAGSFEASDPAVALAGVDAWSTLIPAVLKAARRILSAASSLNDLASAARSFAHSYDDKPYSQRAAAKDGGEVEMYSPLTR
jgi:hypothetical protein